MTDHNPLTGPPPEKYLQYWGLTDREVEDVILSFLSAREEKGKNATDDEVRDLVALVHQEIFVARFTLELFRLMQNGLVRVDLDNGKLLWGNHPAVQKLLESEIEAAWKPGEEIDLATGEKIDNHDQR